MASADTTPLSTPLLAWWDEGHAAWPWRESDDPYAIWVSEVMLQQTQIATVIPYYERWMARFPNVGALAAAPLDDVLQEWQGLGYYSRARNLHAAAQIVAAEHGAELPDKMETLLKLPGIGRYTAGAIASIAFNTAVPVVDGNVIRALTRLFDIDDDITRAATQRKLWELAEQLLHPKRPGDHNQALMELGQTICTPADPQCVLCPINSYCQAQRKGTQYERPVRPPRKRIPHYDVVAGVIWRDGPARDGAFLITKRPLDGMLGGLWEFPGGKVEAEESLQQALAREIKEELGIAIAVQEPLCLVKHAYTHFRISLHALCARYMGGPIVYKGVDDHAWVTLDDVEQFAFAVTDLKIIANLKEMLAAG